MLVNQAVTNSRSAQLKLFRQDGERRHNRFTCNKSNFFQFLLRLVQVSFNATTAYNILWGFKKLPREVNGFDEMSFSLLFQHYALGKQVFKKRP